MTGQADDPGGAPPGRAARRVRAPSDPFPTTVPRVLPVTVSAIAAEEGENVPKQGDTAPPSDTAPEEEPRGGDPFSGISSQFRPAPPTPPGAVRTVHHFRLMGR
ncbi:hypothetical protein GCM10027294_23180 [Marinactinospora endophytica]